MKAFLQEGSDKSLTRLLALIAGLTACSLAITQEVLHAFFEDFQRDNSIVGILLTFAGATKVGQKYVEFQNKKHENTIKNSSDSGGVDSDVSDS